MPQGIGAGAAAETLAHLADQRGLEAVVRLLESWARTEP
jgi:hypothetical protein